jgi:hypothetical protein
VATGSVRIIMLGSNNNTAINGVIFFSTIGREWAVRLAISVLPF